MTTATTTNEANGATTRASAPTDMITSERAQGDDRLIFEKGAPGRTGTPLPPLRAQGDPLARIPAALRRRGAPALPRVSEPEAVRHYTRLSRKNFSIDTNFYPLGSCTMKYNPRACEAVAAMPGFSGMHPLQADEDSQGTLAALHDLQDVLAHVTGLPGVSLTPVAGAQGEYCGVAIIKAWHERNRTGRDTILVPDSAHGTNPASAAMAGFGVKTIKSGADGRVDLGSLRAALDEKTAGIMLTNPNTCGMFEENILEIAEMVHAAGALLYYDGANLNAIVGRARPGDMGFDVVHLNLHKTFSTPHGGGGPGAGPIAVRADLTDFLPSPRVVRRADGSFAREDGGPDGIGRFHAFQGNAGVLIRAWTYALLQGGDGLRDISTNSVLNANYLLARLRDRFEAPFPDPCKHEFILTLKREAREKKIKAFDVAKRLLDFGIHAPTIYFPLLVPECLLIEPTENETKQTLDAFVEVMLRLRDEIDNDPEVLLSAPNDLARSRLDDVKAARQINVCCEMCLTPAE